MKERIIEIPRGIQTRRSKNFEVYLEIAREITDSHDLLNQKIINKRTKAMMGISSAKEQLNSFKNSLVGEGRDNYKSLIEILEKNIRGAEKDIEKSFIYIPTKNLRDFSKVIRLFERSCHLFYSELYKRKKIEASQHFLSMLDCLDADNIRRLPKHYHWIVESMKEDVMLATDSLEERGINPSRLWSISLLEKEIAEETIA